MQEIGGAIERIDDPARLVIAAGAALFGEDRVRRIVVADDADDLLLGRAVDLGDLVVPVLCVDFDALELRDAAGDHLAGAPRRAHGNIQQRMHSQLE
jgi:hypothetical protein